MRLVASVVIALSPVAQAMDREPQGQPFPLTVIHTTLAGHPSSEVPGLPGVRFRYTSSSAPFARVSGTPNTSDWLLWARVDRPPEQDEVVLINGALTLAEGAPAPWAPGETVGTFGTRLAMDDAGAWSFTNTTFNAFPDVNDYVVRYSAGTYTAVAREGDGVPGLTGATWGRVFDSASLTANGVALRSDLLGGTSFPQNEILWHGGSVIAQAGVTAPHGQSGSEVWENFAANGFWTSPDGKTWLAHGDLTGPTASDTVAVVNGVVQMQEGSPIPGSFDFTGVLSIAGPHIDPGGHWFIRATSAFERCWLVRDGALLARRGMAIHPGTIESWDDQPYPGCFFAHTGNSRGDFVVAGVTNSANLSANAVIVLNGQRVVVREYDAIDLNGNGLPDDNLFLDLFYSEMVLTRTGYLYFTATMRNALLQTVGAGFFRLDLTRYVPVELTTFAVE